MADLSQMCSFVMMRINSFLDKELDEATADKIREHLADCEQCLNEVEIWTTIRSSIKHAYPPGTAPKHLIDKVTQMIHRSEQSLPDR